MMRDDWNEPPFAGANQLAREQEIARDAEVVRPDQAVVRSRVPQKFRSSDANVSGQRRGRSPLLGEVIEGGINDPCNWRGRELLLEVIVPLLVARFAAGQDDRLNFGVEVAH